MRKTFVKTTNVDRFLAATAAINDRGAPEASIVLIQGDAGYGKSKTGEWWAVRNNAIFIRLKAAATPHWVLTDMVRELGEQAPAHTSEKLFGQVISVLAKDPRPIVVDEVENGLQPIAVLETIRDVADLTLVPVVFIGRQHVWGQLKRYSHFRTRIGARADFGPMTEADTRKVFDELCEVPVEADLIQAVHEQSDGHIRETVKAVKNVERFGNRNKGKKLDAVAMNGQVLVHDWQKPEKKVA